MKCYNDFMLQICSRNTVDMDELVTCICFFSFTIMYV